MNYQKQIIGLSIDIDQMSRYPNYFSLDYQYPRIIVFTNINNFNLILII